jgi:DNA-binding GntR family transcriptional regulator
MKALAGLEGSAVGSALEPIRRGKTTAEVVAERLVLAIARGEKTAGERVTEAEIAEALNVSRVPAREAMQKLQIMGILVGSPERRGLRVLDYSQRRIDELFELRFAVEKIIFQHVFRGDVDRVSLAVRLDGILEDMRQLSGSGDPLALAAVDLDFHRAVAAHSGNELAAQNWESLAQHMTIVFCRDWSVAGDRTGEVKLHARLIDFVRYGDPRDIDNVLHDHFRPPDERAKRPRRR